MQWLETSKYTIFLIIYWNFKIYGTKINVFIKKFNEKIYLNVSYDFSKFDES
jgi:hypothetical protein